MKNYKIFTLAACLLAIAACEKEKEFVIPGGLDASKPAVASFEYDDASSGSAAAAFTWTADQAIAAGATSFTVELNTDYTVENPTNDSRFIIVDAPATSGIISKRLKKNEFYYARIRANYPGYYFSNWTYLGSASDPMVVCIGTGAMNAKFGAPANLTVLSVTDVSIKVGWDAVAFAESYAFEYKPASSGDWTVVSEITANSYEVEGLVPLTSYDVRVRAYRENEASEYATLSVTTAEPSGFDPAIKTPDAFVEFLTSEAPAASSVSEYTLEADIDLSGKTLPAVESFKGVLDGKGHSIKGLDVKAPLFTELAGTVKNLVLEGAAAPETKVFGVLAGSGNGTISNVTNKVAVTYAADAITEETLIAGIIGNAGGEVSGSTNAGAISVTSASGIVNLAVGGVAAKASGSFSNCSNSGKVSVESLYCSIRKSGTIVANADYAPCVAGVVGYALDGFSMSDSSNSGAVVFKNSAIDKTDGAVERILVAGVVAATYGNMTKCSNTGKIEIETITSDRAARTGSGTSYIVCAGGIAGGDYYAGADQTGTTLSNCTNSGEIVFVSDASNANSTVGGIVGWPGVEGKTSVSTSDNCTNTGKITVDGVVKVRVGGIAGGSGHIKNCSNDSEIVINNANSASVAAFICGFHTQNHEFVNNVAKGKMEVKAKIDGAGGLIGGQGNQAIESGTGCKANCTFTTTSETTNIGLVVGKFSTGAAIVVLGTAADPIKIKGNVNGTELTAANYASYIGGNYPVDNKTVNAAFGE